MNKNKKAFTLVELIVVITILAILGTIAFISLQGYSKKARDSRRISDISNIKTSLELFSLNTGYYPEPDNGLDVDYNTELLFTQGTIGDTVTTNLSRNLNEKPLDPLFNLEYIYSLSTSKKEYEVMSINEGDLATNNLINSSYAASNYTVKVGGNYNEVFVKTTSYIVPIPSIISSENLPLDLFSTPAAISSMIVTNGTNFPDLNIANTTQTTGELAMILSVTGAIDSNSTDAEKISVIDYIQVAYNGSDLESGSIYQNILSKSTDEDKLALVENIVLNSSNVVVQEQAVDLNGNDEFTKLLLHSDIDYTNFDTDMDFTGEDNDLPLGNVRGTPPVYISNNKLYMSNPGGVNGGFYTDYRLEGDFDIQIDFELLNAPNANRWEFALMVQAEDSSYLSMRIDSSNLGREYRVSGNITGTRTNPIVQTLTSDDNGKLRITRVGSTYDTYYWNNTTSNWVKLTSGVTGPTTSVLIHITNGSGYDNPAAEINFDNLQINSGSVTKYRKFEDDSSISNTITRNGHTHHSETNSKFGSTSMYFDGDGDYLSVPDSDDWDFGSEDFTIDFWYQPQEISGYGRLVSKWNPNISSNSFLLTHNIDTSQLIFSYSSDGTSVTGQKIETWNSIIDQWYHIAIVRSGESLYLFVDGLPLGIAHNIDAFSLFPSTTPLLLGVDIDASGTPNINGWLNGYLDEFRISKGIARIEDEDDFMYDSEGDGFDTPTAPYGN